MIDYRKIARAVEFYRECGFKYIEVPWAVSEATLNITKPEWAQPFETICGSLVASGEQSFLELRHVLRGRFVCVTPCFRDEQEVDDIHRNYFMKVELIDARPNDLDKSMWELLEYAKQFFELYEFTEIVNTDEGKDIYINGLEVGSYGIRSYKDFHWCYGTGVAEPRLSQALMI